MATSSDRPEPSDDDAFLGLFRAIASSDRLEVSLRIDSAYDLATGAIVIGGSRQDADTYFLEAICHYVYGGDTALHIAAAAYQVEIAESLVARGAAIRARNRRGAEPLHYAADGVPGASYWDPAAQRVLVGYLIDAGADPDARDNSGVAPLHRAVRTRSSAAVEALLEGGADPLLRNKSGSTPLHLAVQNTGRGSSGSEAARDEQREIIMTLMRYGASPSDMDSNGKTVEAAAISEWTRELLIST